MKSQQAIFILLLFATGCVGATNATEDVLTTTASAVVAAPTVQTLSGTDIALDDLKGNGAVFVFMRDDCPIANRYAPELHAIRNDYASAGVKFFLVYPDPSTTVEAIEAHQAEYRLEIDAIHDPLHLVVDYTGATITPEAAVFDKENQLVYLGRIDDLYADFGVERRVAAKHDLREILDQVVAGESLSFSSQKAVGCIIADLR